MVKRCSLCKKEGHNSSNSLFHSKQSKKTSIIISDDHTMSSTPTSVNEVVVVKVTPVNKTNLYQWVTEKGNTLPSCINTGCTNSVTIRHWSAQGDPSLKTECGRCSSARKNNKALPGVIFHKKKFCENKDSILGFKCPMDPLRYEEFPYDIYHMDHVDGNHTNNVVENIKTFCAICHTRKGKESGDFNGHKQSSRIHKA